MNKLNTFIDFFKFLGYTVPNKIDSRIDKCIEVIMTESETFNIYDLIDEIEKELGRHNNPKLFIQRILLRFENISKFLLINLEKEYTTSLGKKAIIINGITHYEDHIFSHNTLEKFYCWNEQKYDESKASIYEKYVVDCFFDFDFFFLLLDKLCLDYEIDIIKIQEEKNIIIWIRKLNSLLENENTPKLKSIINTKLENSSEITKVKKELHINIFKNNAFEVFEKYHGTKNITESNRTDLRVLFELFQKDSLFNETVELKHYIAWLNKTYGYNLTELKKINLNTNPNIQRTNDYKAYKESTLKQP